MEDRRARRKEEVRRRDEGERRRWIDWRAMVFPPTNNAVQVALVRSTITASSSDSLIPSFCRPYNNRHNRPPPLNTTPNTPASRPYPNLSAHSRPNPSLCRPTPSTSLSYRPRGKNGWSGFQTLAASVAGIASTTLDAGTWPGIIRSAAVRPVRESQDCLSPARDRPPLQMSTLSRSRVCATAVAPDVFGLLFFLF